MSTHIFTVWHYNADSLPQQPENNELPHKKPSVMAISGQNHGGVGKLGLVIRRRTEPGQGLLVPRYTVILVSHKVYSNPEMSLKSKGWSSLSGPLLELRNVPIAVELANHRTILAFGKGIIIAVPRP